MEATKDAKVMATREETEEHEWERLISLFKKVKVSTSFVEKLEKELGYLEFQKGVDLKRQELQKSKPIRKEEHINVIEVGEDTRQA